MDLQVAMDKLSKTLSDKIAANAAEDLRTGAKVVENAMDIRKVVDALNETRQALNANAASTKEAHAAIAEVNTAVEGLNGVYQHGADAPGKRGRAQEALCRRSRGREMGSRGSRGQTAIDDRGTAGPRDRLEGQKASQPTVHNELGRRDRRSRLWWLQSWQP